MGIKPGTSQSVVQMCPHLSDHLGPMSEVTSACSSCYCARPLVCCISINKDGRYEFHLLLALQSRSRNDVYKSLSEEKRIERNINFIHIMHLLIILSKIQILKKYHCVMNFLLRCKIRLHH